MPVHISDVTRDPKLADDLVEKVEDPSVTGDSCDALLEKNNLKKLIHFPFVDEPDFDYRPLVQSALDKGLNVFNKVYPANEDAWKKIWQDEAGANVSYLLAANSTQIGCIIGKCTDTTASSPSTSAQKQGAAQTNDAVLFCQLSPAATENQAPFDEDYFNALITRKTQLSDMTEEDLKLPSNGTSTAAALPAILVVGLAAMLATVSL
ncbi:SAG family member [Eimeria praecox]|uniref:SAG family member n=1 Tax=Eimeria praecox TaxID=51316 RepID=U6G4C0_9EIME|nr:SAG family member [Eimeria praecox]